jgi:hypothetical protein
MENDRRNTDPEANLRDIRRRIAKLRSILYPDTPRRRPIRENAEVEEQTQRHKSQPKGNPAADKFKENLLKLKEQKKDREWKS